MQCKPRHLQDFDGEAGEAKAGRDYFRRRFVRLSQKAGRSKEREIYVQCVFLPNFPPHADRFWLESVTTATDTAMLRVVMAAVEGQCFILSLWFYSLTVPTE